ncbi:MAG: hypothetical protein LBF33_03830 [Oscillospiraceae bacterium]|jgi:hypothetical protein|nr:hypothetical protein [Oscillospiraceae bacterium]
MLKENKVYDLSLFEAQTTEHKQKILNISRELFENNTKHKLCLKHVLSIITAIFIALTFSINVINSQIELSELTDKIYKNKRLLEESENTETQIRLGLESNLSLKDVEEYAKNILKMQKPEAYQISYINVPTKNKAEIYKS